MVRTPDGRTVLWISPRTSTRSAATWSSSLGAERRARRGAGADGPAARGVAPPPAPRRPRRRRARADRATPDRPRRGPGLGQGRQLVYVGAPDAPVAAARAAAADDGGTARLTLRMPDALKNAVEEAAEAIGDLGERMARATRSQTALGRVDGPTTTRRGRATGSPGTRRAEERTRCNRRFDTPGAVTCSRSRSATATSKCGRPTRRRTTVEISGYDKRAPPRVTCDAQPDGGSPGLDRAQTEEDLGLHASAAAPRSRSPCRSGPRSTARAAAADLEARGTLAVARVPDGLGRRRVRRGAGDVQHRVRQRRRRGALGRRPPRGQGRLGRPRGRQRRGRGDRSQRIGRHRDPAAGRIEHDHRRLRRHRAPRRGGGRRERPGDLRGRRRGRAARARGVWLDVSSTSGDVHSALEPAERDDATRATRAGAHRLTVSGDVDDPSQRGGSD